MLATIIAAVVTAFAATPGLAASHISYPKPATVLHTAVAGDYAVVQTRGGSIEGTPNTTPVLLERFAFGWQPIALVDRSCELHARGVSLARARALGLASARAVRDPSCAFIGSDAGAPAEVAAVRKIAQGPLVPYVHVSGPYALSDWYGAGGGIELYEKTGTTWTRITGGGGTLSAREAASYGVPESRACALGLSGKTCAKTASH